MHFTIGQVKLSWTSKGISAIIPIDNRELILTVNVTPNEDLQLDVRLTVGNKVSEDFPDAE